MRKTRLGRRPSTIFFAGRRPTPRPGRRTRSVSGPIIQEKASKFAMGLTDFKASNGWLESWKSHHSMKGLKVSGESAGVNQETVDDFKKRLPSITSSYRSEDVFNCDKKGLFDFWCVNQFCHLFEDISLICTYVLYFIILKIVLTFVLTVLCFVLLLGWLEAVLQDERDNTYSPAAQGLGEDHEKGQILHVEVAHGQLQ